MDTLKIIIVGLIALFLVIEVSFTLAEKDCRNKAEIMNKPYTFSKLSGCFIKTEKGYVDYSKYRILNLNETLGEE